VKDGVFFLLELLGVAGLVSLLAYITWTKMALGAVLTLLGAFFPSLKDARQKLAGEGQVSWRGFLLKINGGIRFLVVIGGIILLIGAVLDGHEGYVKESRFLAEKSAVEPELRRTLSIALRSVRDGSSKGLTLLKRPFPDVAFLKYESQSVLESDWGLPEGCSSGSLSECFDHRYWDYDFGKLVEGNAAREIELELRFDSYGQVIAARWEVQ
jgi:hypothetical protein